MREYKDQFINVCPYCGGTEMVEAYQDAYGAISGTQNKLGGCALYHCICRGCGSVLRSYVKDPEKLLKRKDRRKGKTDINL